jgi:hypothetical protein
MSHVDAIVIDTYSYPYPSGIVIRARQQGLPVIIANADSFLRDLSEIDPGIVILDLAKVSKKKLRDVLSSARSQQKFQGATREELQQRFIEVWKNAIE